MYATLAWTKAIYFFFSEHSISNTEWSMIKGGSRCAPQFYLGATSRTRIEIRKIAASFLLAMTAIFMLSPFVAAMGNKNSRHREERNDLHLFLSPKNADKLPRNAGHTRFISGLLMDIQFFPFLAIYYSQNSRLPSQTAHQSRRQPTSTFDIR